MVDGVPAQDAGEETAAAAAQRALEKAVRRLWEASLDDARPARPRYVRPPQDAPGRPATGSDADSGVGAVAAELRAGRASAVQLAKEALARATAARERLGAFVTVTEDIALEAARRADRELAAGRDRGVLHGIPVAVKDVIDVAGVRTANGTPGLGWRVPRHDAAAWSTLARAGAVMVGKTTTHELAWGATTPGCRNPIDLARSPGGSSGGSAAAVASGVVPVALGTDTGGSVRLPAAHCGVVGFRPAAGSVPMTGITPLAPTQDVVGPLATTVADCAVAARMLAGLPDPPDPDAGPHRFGVIDDAWVTRIDAGVAAVFASACSRLDCERTRPVSIHVALAELAPAASYVTMLAESGRGWWDVVRAEPRAVGAQVRALLRVGACVDPRDHRRALAVSKAIRASLCAALTEAGVDVCALPTVPVTAQPIDAVSADVGGRELGVEAAYVAFTALAAVTGLAAVSVPCGAAAGMPVGFQLIAAPGREGTLWSLAQRVELLRDPIPAERAS